MVFLFLSGEELEAKKKFASMNTVVVSEMVAAVSKGEFCEEARKNGKCLESGLDCSRDWWTGAHRCVFPPSVKRVGGCYFCVAKVTEKIGGEKFRLPTNQIQHLLRINKLSRVCGDS